MKEKWLPVSEFSELYAVSDWGRVKTLVDRGYSRAGRLLKPRPNTIGYLQVCLTVSGKSWHRYVHRLMALAFIGEIPGGHSVNHINGIKTDNRLVNLEIIPHAENIRHAHRHGLITTNPNYGTDHHMAKLSEDDVLSIRALYADGARRIDLSRKFSVSPKNIECIVRRKTWTHI